MTSRVTFLLFVSLFYAITCICFVELTAINAQSNFGSDNLAVIVAAASANNTTASIVEINKVTTGQSPIQTINIPGTGTDAIRVSGSATSTLYAANSDDGTLFCFTGHNSTNTSVNVNTLQTGKAVVTITNNGTVNIATTYNGTGTNQTRGATTLNNTTLFIGDQGGFYTNNSTSASPSGNIRSVKAFGGTVYAFTASASLAPVGVISAPSSGTFTALPGLPVGATSRQDFYLISSGSNGSAFDILYVLDATSATAGTIFKFSLVSGSWTANGTYSTGAGGFGMCAEKSGSGANIFFTTGTGATTANSVIKLADAAGHNATINITSPTTLFTAATGTIIKGIAFAPKAPPALPAVSLSINPDNGSEQDQTVITVTATTDIPVAGDQTVSVAVSGTGITAGDYVLSSSTITIPGGQTSGSVTFTIVDDMEVEGTETATLTITNPSAGVIIGSPSNRNITILDNDVPPPPAVSLSVSTSSGNEADATSITITATAASPVSGNQTVNLSISGAGITSADYFIRPANITIANGQTTGTATFVIADDAIHEPTEVATISITSASAGLSIGSPSLQNITIFNNDCSFLRKIGGSTSVIGAEIPAFDPGSNRLYVVAATDTEIYSISSAGTLTNLGVLPKGFTPPAGTIAEPNSVSIKNGIAAIAYAIRNTSNNAQEPGVVGFYNAADGSYIHSVNVGYLPDMLTFSPDGSKVVTADEGEPNSYGQANSFDPEGSVSIIDISGGIANATVQIAGFSAFNSQEATLKAAGVRIFGPGATVAQDLEPEYIAFSGDGSKAFVTLQENNAFAILDIPTATITDIKPLGLKDFNASGNTLDASDQDGGSINMQNWPVYGMYMPDAIASYTIGGNTYYITANEGDARDYTGYAEEIRVNNASYVLDPTIFPNASTLKMNANLGRLQVSRATGNLDMDTEYERIDMFGARSFSIWNDMGNLVFDSGNELELLSAQRMPSVFNSDGTTASFDGRSDNKGPEPEGVCIGEMGGQIYAFVGIERTGDVAVYNVTNPLAPQLVQYINLPEDLNVEGLIFVPAENSPTGVALLITAAEVSKTISVFEVGRVIVTNVANNGSGTLRAAIDCVVEGGVITYDQEASPPIETTILTEHLDIYKSLTIKGQSATQKPEIIVDFNGITAEYGIGILSDKLILLVNVDFQDINNTSPAKPVIEVNANAVLEIPASTIILKN